MIVQNTVIPIQNTTLDKSKAEVFFATFPREKVSEYKDYWESIKPKNKDDIFRRYLFAYCSVHTTWKGNCAGYNAIKDFNDWINDKETLREKLHKSGVGLHNNRTNYIWDFATKFWANPKDFYFTTKKGHVKKRDSIVSKINGIGLAKISFALEMIHPNEARVLCGDIHQLRLYDMEHLKYNKSAVGIDTYKKMERHWVVNCGKHKVPPYIARSIYWDALQNKENSRYWSFVFEA